MMQFANVLPSAMEEISSLGLARIADTSFPRSACSLAKRRVCHWLKEKNADSAAAKRKLATENPAMRDRDRYGSINDSIEEPDFRVPRGAWPSELLTLEWKEDSPSIWVCS